MSTTGKVTGIIANLVTVEVNGPVAQNEICYIKLGESKLMAEVIKVNGKSASVQVYESTRGVKKGNDVEFMGFMLEATLGPGLLSSNYDGLQNNLSTMTGVFLQRGEYTAPIDMDKEWDFTPIAKPGDTEHLQPTKRFAQFIRIDCFASCSFSVSFSRIVCRFSRCSLVESLFIISKGQRFVNTFFEIFFIFLNFSFFDA
ncbi:MAG: hypothetical protein II266_03885 [Clostridia bacterium]|nr:hypothetical protein [Clostridia bacterium]